MVVRDISENLSAIVAAVAVTISSASGQVFCEMALGRMR